MTEKHSFQAEVQKVLDLMIHSVYSNKEVFLRELISNASDAIDKRKFLSLSKADLAPNSNDYKIQITTNPENKSLTINDNGVGMSKEEMMEHLGTIAKSGTKQFIEMAKDIKENPELIGQFGVGFYSSFMVADSVEVISKKAGEDKAYKWTSSGDGTYEITEATKDEAGTEITLKLKPTDDDNKQDFTEEWTLKSLIKKYSDFISHPIQLFTTKYEYDDKGQIVEGKTKQEWETVNSQKALWTRSPSEVSKEEYSEFYKQIASDWNEPQETIHYKAEGSMEFSSLLYIPSKRPFNFNTIDAKKGLQLYVRRVFILDHCDDLMPEYLRFVKGMVDSDDLSLNISREMLQQDRQVQAIRKNLVKKVLSTLKDLLNKNRDDYMKFWNNFGAVLKEGVASDHANHDKLSDLLLFKTTAQDSMTTLSEYVERMPTEQKEIYYLTGGNIDQLRSSPHLESLKDKGFEVLLLDDDIDEWVVGHMTVYKEKPLKSIAKGNLDIESEEEKKAKEEENKKLSEDYKDLISNMKEALKEEVKEVRLSSRLKDSAVVLVSDEEDMSINMQRIISEHKGETEKIKRILEINPKHAIFSKMKTAKVEEQKDWAELFYGQALLMEGSQVPNPISFSEKLNKLMLK